MTYAISEGDIPLFTNGKDDSTKSGNLGGIFGRFGALTGSCGVRDG